MIRLFHSAVAILIPAILASAVSAQAPAASGTLTIKARRVIDGIAGLSTTP
jgi:hypothetical protein